MAKVVVTVPDKASRFDVCEYVRLVADQIEETYVSGYVNHETYWDIEGDASWD